MIRLSSTVHAFGYFALIAVVTHQVEVGRSFAKMCSLSLSSPNASDPFQSLYWGGTRTSGGVRSLFAFTGESTAGLSACSDAGLVSCRRVGVDLEALLEDDRLFVPGVGVIDKTKPKPDPEAVDEFGLSYVEYQLEQGPDGRRRRKKKVITGGDPMLCFGQERSGRSDEMIIMTNL